MNKVILKNSNVYVIAEVGSNFGGDLTTALKYIDACAAAGANAVKFQSWNTATLQNAINIDTGEAEAAIPVLEKYELPDEWHQELKQHCDAKGIDFLSTPFDLSKARMLRGLGCKAIKIASGDLTYHQLLCEVAGYGLPVFLSTGMSEMDEIEAALVALGDARKDTVLLHCVGAYPPDIEDANLKAIMTLAEQFQLPVGFSDHYPGSTLAIAAVALGARVIEKHVTFSREAGHPDSPFAMEMDEFAAMIEQIRQLEMALGDGVKSCRPSEQGGRIGGRRMAYWIKDIAAENIVDENCMAPLRPAKGGIAPVDMDKLYGKKLARAVVAGQPVDMSDFAA